MNVHAYNLMVTLRAILGALPGGSSIGIHAYETWTIVVITTSSDEAVSVLSEVLGLGATEIKSVTARWWRQAASEREHGALRIEVNGPQHPGPLPRNDAGRGAS